MSKKQKAVVLGRNYASLLGMVRASGKAGCQVTVIRTVRRIPETGTLKVKIKEMLTGAQPESVSQYVEKYLYCRESKREELVRLLLQEFGNETEKVILLPTDDYTASTIDLYQEKLKEHFLFPHIRHEQGAIVKLMDKNVQKKKAIASGLNVAKGWIIRIKDGEYEIPPDIACPCFTKPEISFLGNKRCMKRCNNPEELTEVIATQGNCPLLVEQYFEIEKEYAILGFSDGENVIMPDIIQMLLSGQGAHKGVTLKGIIRPLSAETELFKNLCDFIKSLQFTGLFDIDLFESGGKVYFNELNLRFGASGYSVTASGINLPELLISCLKGEKINLNPPPKIRESYFINEKVLLDDYENGYFTWEQYQEHKNCEGIHFIQSEEDPQPFIHFRRRERKDRLKAIAKGNRK